jgi:hypothetical protein
MLGNLTDWIGLHKKSIALVAGGLFLAVIIATFSC